MKLKNKTMLIGLVVLGIGVGLLIFTFVAAFVFLTRDIAIPNAEDLGETFAHSIAPLIILCSRLMYLGVMGWVGGILTSRGAHLLLASDKEKHDKPKKEKAAA